MSSDTHSTSPPSPSLMSLGSSRASSPFEVAVTEAPMDQAGELDANKGKHAQYYFEDGNIIFLIEDTLYNVHRYFFARDSSHFRAILQVTDMSHPCVMLDVNCADFDEFLAILYPTDFRRPMEKTAAQWTSILHLAAKWGFANIKLLAIDNLTAHATPIDKIVLGRRYSIIDWLLGAYEAVCTRADPLTVEEGMKLGVEDTVRISAARQLYGIGKARFKAKYLAGHLEEIFSLEKSEGSLAKASTTVPAEGMESLFGTEVEEVVRTRTDLRVPSHPGSESEVAGEAAGERIPETANYTTAIPTEHRVSHISSPPPSSPPVRGIFGNAGPLHRSTSTVSLVVDAVPAKLELGIPVDQCSVIVLSPRIDAFMFPLPLSTPKIPVVPHFADAAESNLLLRLASGEDPMPHPKPTAGGAAIQRKFPSSVYMVPAEGRLKNRQDNTDTRSSIPEHLLIGIAAGDGEAVPTAYPASPKTVYPENTPPSPPGPGPGPGETSSSIRDNLGVREEVTAVGLEVKSGSDTAAVTSPFDYLATLLPTSTALKHPARHESQLTSPRPTIPEEPTRDNGHNNAISLADISATSSKGHSGDNGGSQQGDREDVEDVGSRAANTSTGQGRSEAQDVYDSNGRKLSNNQKKRLIAKLRKEKEHAERIKNVRR